MLVGLRSWFDWAVALLAGGVTATLFVVVMLGVISRAANDPFIWTDELARFLMAWVAVLGWVLVSRRRVHVRIRYFRDKLPPPVRRVAEIIMQSSLVVFGVLVAWFGVAVTIRNLDIEATTLPISISWLYVPLVLAGVVTALQGIAEIVEQCRPVASPVGGEAGK
jgi:TRAP-type C4-dicarboxylate transport system permease small subunit